MTISFERRRQLIALLASSAAAAGLSACGGGSGGSAASGSTPVSTSPTSGTSDGTGSAGSAGSTGGTGTTGGTGSTGSTGSTGTTGGTGTSGGSTDTGTGTGTTDTTTPATDPASAPVVAKSAKRGIAYDLADAADLAALAPGLSWWYNWGAKPGINQTVAKLKSTYQMDYFPMLWDENADPVAMTTYLKANPGIKYLLLMNEPNLTDQANLSPSDAAAVWPKYEAVAAATGVKLVGPAITWGTLAGYSDPVVWMDAFLAAYKAANSGRSPQIDYLAFHWYDYDLGGQLDRLTKYGKPFWVTEMANWHNGDGSAQIDTVEKQKAQMTTMVALCESRADVLRYAWFIGRMSPDPHYTSLLGASGVLSELGKLYISLPFTAS